MSVKNRSSPNLLRVVRIGLQLLLLSFLIIYFIWLFEILTGSYEIRDKDLYRLDKMALQSKAYEYSGGRYSFPRFEFRDTSGYNFSLSDASFKAVINKKQLSDTLQYNWTEFVAFTDKKGFDNYKKGKKNKGINVYQFYIGKQKYVDKDETNSIIKGTLLVNILFLSVLFSIILISYRNEKQKSRKSGNECNDLSSTIN